ncbi:MAG: AAA family ATPase [Myxococcales bacterium]|nr:AAA family ATPase [Myxococcales bacterium]
MFTFRAVEVMNWDYWSHVRLPLDDRVVLVAGPNGSGKTTLLDAIRVLLNATRLSTSRKLPQYLREDTGVAVIKALVDNPPTHAGRRPWSHLGRFEDEVTLACVLERKKGKWERRYLVVGGDAPIETLKDLSGSLRPMEFSRELELAQVPRTLLKILALEQGETHKLARRTPVQLLEYVLEMQGDKAVLERYGEARATFLSGQRDLEGFEQRLTVMRLHVDTLRRDAESYERFVQLKDSEQEVREERLPAARFKALTDQLATLKVERERAQRTLAEADGVLSGFHRESDGLGKGVEEIKASIVEKKQAYQTLLKDKEKLDSSYRDLKRWVQEFEDSGGSADQKDVHKLIDERERLMTAEGGIRGELTSLLGKIGKLRRERESLSTGDSRRRPPDWVQRMVRELRGMDIPHSLVADMVEITDDHWHVAVESILGRERFTILVDREHTLPARKLAQRQRYRCYVSEYGPRTRAKPRRGSALDVVRFSDPRVPENVTRMLNSVTLVETVEDGHGLGRGSITITPDGYKQDARGGIFVGTQDLYCGSGAGEHRTHQIDGELGQLRSRRDELQRSLQPTNARVRVIDEQLAAAKARGRLLDRLGDPESLKERLADLSEKRRAASERLMALLGEVDDANNQLIDKERRISLLEYRHREALLERDRARSSAATVDSRISRVTTDLVEVEKRVPEALRGPAALELLESEVVLVERLNSLRRRVEGWTGTRDARAVALWQKSHAELVDHDRQLARRRHELDESTDELTQARRAYVRVVEETIRRYRRNVLALGELCRVEVDVHVPGADQLHAEGDALLGRAGLEVRVGFDGKRPVPVNDSRLSGGQSVVASLILLMALTMNDDGQTAGFFILDEPFAHLSIERIDEVARFLEVTRAQFLITTPTTHNLRVYNPAGLTLNLRKKAGTARFAPVPTFLRRIRTELPQVAN